LAHTEHKEERRSDPNIDPLFKINGEQFVLLAVTIAISLAKGRTAAEIRFLSNLFYQVSTSLGAISTQKKFVGEELII